jgi:hypothetical protein
VESVDKRTFCLARPVLTYGSIRGRGTMSLSKTDKIWSRRERDFQQKVLAALRSQQEPTARVGLARRFFGRFLKIVNSGAFLSLATIVVSFGIFYHHTYVSCVANSRKFYSEYASLKMELYLRQGQIAASVYEANSIQALRETLSHEKSFDRQFKDNSTLELQTRQMVQAASIDMSGIGHDLAKTLLEKVEVYQKYKALYLNGILDETASDSDLATLKALSVGVLELNALQFIADLRNVAQIECTPANIFSLMWGDQPITIRKYDAGSFVEREKIHQQIEAARNHLNPKAPPPPFPETTFKAPAPQSKQ